MSCQETSFVTLGQRFLAIPLKCVPRGQCIGVCISVQICDRIA